ncbi:MAG: DUF4358 domain-containing protein [Clostridia bacterium]|nr:DUF4358 domain-containing protein [Clostridia bacterium]
MKKIFAVILSAMLITSLTACGSSESGTNSKTESVVSSASSESSKAESKDESSGSESGAESSVLKTAIEKVKAEVELPSDMADFDARRLKRVFGITEEQAEDFSGAICTDGLKQDEFIYIKAKDESTAKEVADKLQNDWQSKYNVIKNYDPNQVKIIESAKVETNGLYVFLVISEKADQIKQIYNDAIKS